MTLNYPPASAFEEPGLYVCFTMSGLCSHCHWEFSFSLSEAGSIGDTSLYIALDGC